MAEDQRAEGHAVIGVAVAVDIGEAGAGRRCNEHGLVIEMAERAHGGMHATRRVPAGARVQRLRFVAGQRASHARACRAS